MQWASSVSEKSVLNDAVAECAACVRSEMGSGSPDLALVFASPHFAPDFAQMPATVRRELNPRILIGCSGGGVIGAGREIEDRAGLSLIVARLPGVDLLPFRVEDRDLPDLDASPAAWERLTGAASTDGPSFVLLADPFTIRTDNLLAGLDYAFPGSAKVGGLASGPNKASGNALFLGSQVCWTGAVGIALQGALRLDAIVAQGCRPIGRAMTITSCHQNVLLALDGQKPLAVLRALHDASSDRDKMLINHDLHLGVIADSLKQDLQPGDFLIRNVLGIQEETDGLVTGEVLSEGQVVRFHVRDAITAEEVLVSHLHQYAKDHGSPPGSGALLFSCLGRGVHLFGKPNHDAGIFRREVGAMPLGGFFCNGEIGPVGQGTFLQSFTSAFAIFRPG